MAEYKFIELVDIAQVRHLLESHHRLSQIVYAILDTEENPLIAVGWQDICTQFHRKNPISHARCRESEAYIKTHIHDCTENLLEYRCKNGLIDVAIPIVIAGEHLATFFTGQFFYDDDLPDTDYFLRQSQLLGFDTEEYLKALKRVPVFSREHIRSNIPFLRDMVKILAEMGFKNLKLVREAEERKRVEEKLQTSERQFRTLAENTPNMIIRYDRDLRRVYVNPSYVRETGIPAASAINAVPCGEWLRGSSMPVETYKARLRQVMETGVTAEILLKWEQPDTGKIASHIIHVVAEHDTAGQVVGVLAIGNNVSRLKKAEKLLIAEKSVMELVAGEYPLAAILTLICLTIEEQIDGALCAVMLTDAAGTRFSHVVAPGLPEEICRSIDGMPVVDGVGPCGTAASLHSKVTVSDIANDPLWRKTAPLTLGHGLRSCWSTPVFAGTGVLLGTFITYSRSTGLPERDELQHLERAAHLVSIAIERARAREALQTNLRFLKVLIDTIPSPVYYKNTAGAYLGCNPAFAAVTGVREEDIVGRTVHDLFSPSEADRSEETDRELLAAPGILVFEASIRFADGEVHEVICRKATFGDKDGEPEGILGVLLDVSEIRRNEQVLQANQRKLSEMAVALSLAEERERRRIAAELHDRIGQTLLLGKMKFDALAKKHRSMAQDGIAEDVRRLLADSINDVRSLTQRLHPPMLAGAGLSGALDWLCTNMDSDYGLRVDLVEDKHAKPLTDELRSVVYQSARELLINVAKHAATDHARLVIGRDGQMLKLVVEDLGRGFDLLANSAKGAAECGFGLFNIRERITYLQGDLTVESTPGKGTRVTLRAPLSVGDRQ